MNTWNWIELDYQKEPFDPPLKSFIKIKSNEKVILNKSWDTKIKDKKIKDTKSRIQNKDKNP